MCVRGNGAQSHCLGTTDAQFLCALAILKCGLLPFRGGNGLGCQATEGMDGTRKYAWSRGGQKARPVFFFALRQPARFCLILPD
jgi:hypothetical protein